MIVLGILAPAAGAADKYEIDIPDQATFEPRTDRPDIATIRVKKNGAPAANVSVKIDRIRGDAKFYDPAKGTTSADKSVTLAKTNASGETKLGLLAQDQTTVLFDVTLIDENGTAVPDLRKEMTWEGRPTVGNVLECSRRKTDDCRDGTAFTFYTGMVIDTFASAEHVAYQNLHEAGDVKQAPIAGIDFSHRIVDLGHTGGLWVYGETVHSRRTIPTNCANLSAEERARANCTVDPHNPDTFDVLLRNSTSLEGYVGLRLEPSWGNLAENGSRGFVKAQAGFLSVAGRHDLVDNHHVGVGIIKVNGRFADSYLEFGYGRTDLFEKSNKDRWKVDAFMSYNMKWPRESFIQPFFQLTVDADTSTGSDSVQSFVGFDFDFTQLGRVLGSGN